MTHPLKSWLKAKGLSVTAFCKDRPFSYPTVYKLLKCEGAFSSDTLIDVARATNNEVSVAMLAEALERGRDTGDANAPSEGQAA